MKNIKSFMVTIPLVILFATFSYSTDESEFVSDENDSSSVESILAADENTTDVDDNTSNTDEDVSSSSTITTTKKWKLDWKSIKNAIIQKLTGPVLNGAYRSQDKRFSEEDFAEVMEELWDLCDRDDEKQALFEAAVNLSVLASYFDGRTFPLNFFEFRPPIAQKGVRLVN